MKKRKLLFGCMAALALLLTASCSSDPGVEGPFGNEDPSGNGVSGEEVEVTFSIAPENVVSGTRAGEVGGPGQWQTNIGKAKKIDMLIYAVYEVIKDADGNIDRYNLLYQYGKGPDGNFTGNEKALEDRDTYDGQTIIKDPFKTEDGNDGTCTIELRLMRGKEYSIAFWAQSSETNAFNTADLEKVQVIYKNAENNDELRDAFCKVETFTASSLETNRSVVLTRPMAQVNVGTTGADYKHVLKYKNSFPNMALIESQIKLTGVANRIDILRDYIDTDTTNDFDGEVTFTYATIPAFMFMNAVPTGDDLYKGEDSDEEFLIVDLDGKKDDNNKAINLPYKTAYPTVDNNGNFLTETFKYLSMCYVLVAAEHVSAQEKDETDADQKKKETDAYKSSVLDQVCIYFKGYNPNRIPTDDDYAVEYKAMSLSNVPVHRNWRTNILGGLAWIKDPTDPDPEDPDDPTPTPPDGPDDPSSVFNFTKAYIQVQPLYEDENNSTTEWDPDYPQGWQGWKSNETE